MKQQHVPKYDHPCVTPTSDRDLSIDYQHQHLQGTIHKRYLSNYNEEKCHFTCYYVQKFSQPKDTCNEMLYASFKGALSRHLTTL